MIHGVSIFLNQIISSFFSLKNKKECSFDYLHQNYVRYVEIDAENDFFYKKLTPPSGKNRLISFVRKKNKKHFPTEQRVFLYNKKIRIQRMSTDMFIFSGNAPLHLWRYNSYAHVSAFVWTPDFRVATFIGFLGVVKNILLGRLSFCGILTGESKSNTLLFSVRKKKQKKSRRYIPAHIPLEVLFEEIRKMDIHYVILRWFGDLPKVDDGEDLDILVADDDVEEIEKIFEKFPGILPVDLYSVSGLQGTSHRGISYYPPEFAKKVLDSRLLVNTNFFVPNTEMHFYSLSYHALYHKGFDSSIRSEFMQKNVQADHNYTEVLRNLSKKLTIDSDITLEKLHNLLEGKDFSPSKDLLKRLRKDNQWIREVIFEDKNSLEDFGCLSFFIIREQGNTIDFLSKARSIFKDEGVVIIEEFSLSEEMRVIVKNNARGGNWEKGSWDVDAGLPAYVFIIFDPVPSEPSPLLDKRRYSDLTNNRILVIKEKIRNTFNYGKTKKTNIVHSSDNTEESLGYVSMFCKNSKIITERFWEKRKQIQKKERSKISLLARFKCIFTKMLLFLDDKIGYFLSEIVYHR